MEIGNGSKDVAVGVKRLWGPNAARGSTLRERVELDVYEGSSGQGIE